MKTIGLLLCLFSLFSSNFCHAQKRQPQYIAHYNSEKLKADWGEWQEMELDIAAYEARLTKDFEDNKENFLKRIKDFQDKPPGTQGGIEREYKKFQEQEKQLLQQQNAIDSQVLVRRNQLEKLLYKHLNKALQLVAEQRGYTYVLDAAAINMHINGGEDLTAWLREKLEE